MSYQTQYFCFNSFVVSRTRGFAEAQETRERDKDPEHRFQRFLKTTQKAGHSADQVSGSFGGRPRVVRGGKSGGGGRGRGRGGKMPPAWMLGADTDEEQS